MAFSTSQFSVAAPPKCGSTWLLCVLPEIGIECPRHFNCHVHEPSFATGLPSVAFVRGAQSWLRSWFNDPAIGFSKVPEIDQIHSVPRLGTFRDYALAYMDMMPGQITRFMDLYRAADYAVNIYALPYSLANALNAIGVEYDRAKLESMLPLNVTTKGDFQPLLMGIY